MAPTSRPTIGGVQWYVKGVVWYDGNANRVCDSNVAVNAVGGDVGFSHSVEGGRVSLQLVQCDKDTGWCVSALFSVRSCNDSGQLSSFF